MTTGTIAKPIRSLETHEQCAETRLALGWRVVDGRLVQRWSKRT